ncbi:type II toxin-antitoxin system RelE/ParE family toxin [Kovacikia minuta CCNUW1]|uniref:type II toxin-antitoxin system RelE/ParE family toxin n=1 Tax=Kovacikia minuta TaxID=2931930 RepID=UPI001CCCDED5|nr:type II toxin-antitoxin system RelE/ParE family toxin [Kovacikia minuta]UBF23635.1 type II toxin-antitoxin system RelE/ParE family toxin [Kovacikia minuta CCNUW1]
MNYVLVFRPELRKELDEIYSWYESQELGLGDDFLEQIDEALDRICQIPESSPAVYRDVRRAVIRRFPYIIYYRIVSSRVIVTAVFHGRRNSKVWQART